MNYFLSFLFTIRKGYIKIGYKKAPRETPCHLVKQITFDTEKVRDNLGIGVQSLPNIPKTVKNSKQKDNDWV